MEQLINLSSQDREEDGLCSLEGVGAAIAWLTEQVCVCANFPLLPTLMQLLPPMFLVFCAGSLPLDCSSAVLSLREALLLQPLVAPSVQRILIITAKNVDPQMRGLYGRRAVVVCSGGQDSYVKTEFAVSFRRIPSSILSENLPLDEVDPRREVVLTAFNCTVFAAMGPLSTDGHPKWHSGLEMRAVTSLLEWKGFRWKVVVPTDGYGEVYVNGTLSPGGIKWYLSQGLADIAFCSIWVTANLNLTIRPSPSAWQRMSSRLLVPRPELLVPHWLAFLAALPLSFWCIHLALAAVTSVVVYLCSFRMGEVRSDVGSSVYQAFTLCFQGQLNQQPARWSLRFLHLSWGVLFLLASNAFSSFLVARLTTPNLPEPVNTLEKLISGGYKWTSGFHFVPPDNSGAYFDMKGELEVKWFNTQVSHEGIVAGKTALYAQDMEDMVFIGNPQLFSQQFLSSLMPSKQYLGYQLISILTRRLSSYSQVLSSWLLELYESGIYSKIHSEVLRSPFMKRFFVVTNLNDQKKGGIPLSLVSLRGAFYILLGGLISSIGVFALEIIYHRDILN